MKRTMKKLVSLVLALAISLTATVPAFAAKSTKETINNSIKVFSKEFPDAYIKQEFTSAAKISTRSHVNNLWVK